MAVRVGIVGSGFIAIKHAEALKEIQGAELAGMCTYSDMDKLKAVSKRLDIPAFPSLDAMIKNGGLDAAMICSATVGHFEEIKRIAAEKIPMLVEKPVVGKKELYPQIYKLISQNGIRLFPGHNFVYRKSIRKMKEALAGGALGKVLQSSFTSTQFLDDFGSGHWRAKRVYSEGGALMDSGHHLIYQMLYLCGLPKRIQCYAAKRVLAEMEDEDMAQLNLQMTDDSLCNVTVSWASDWSADFNGIRFLGTDGEMHLTDALYVNGERICDAESYEETFLLEDEAFLEYVEKGQKPLSTFEDSQHTVQIIDAAYRSAKEGSVYSLKWH